MADQEDAVALLILYAVKLKKKRKKRERKVWVNRWLAERNANGAYSNLFNDLRLHDQEEYRQYLRMSTDTFMNILQYT